VGELPAPGRGRLSGRRLGSHGAFWNEAVTPDLSGRRYFLAHESANRFRQLRAVVDVCATPLQRLLGPVRTPDEMSIMKM
jgi:hypothetical protein